MQHANTVLPDSLVNKMKQGVDFFATGNFPVQWSASINTIDEIKFYAADGSSVRVLAVAPVKLSSIAASNYHIKTSNSLLDIMVYESACAGGKQRKVEVTLNKKLYTGCGQYLYDPALKGKWILDKVNNIPQAAIDYASGLPFLDFNLETNKVAGNDGCNRISGSIELFGKQIRFSPFNIAQKGCKNNAMEKIYNQMLSNQLISYQVKNNYLMLSLPDDKLINFRRQ
ncbi:MAG: META domain-containing protein [Ferruginibacter sp.]